CGAVTTNVEEFAGHPKRVLVPRQATFARQGAASGACSRRAGRKTPLMDRTYLGFRPVRRVGAPPTPLRQWGSVPGVATGRTLPVGALAEQIRFAAADVLPQWLV